MNQGVHSIDFIAWIMGGVQSVYAKTGTFTHTIEAEDVGSVLVTFRNGALGNITCTTSAYPGLTNDFHVFGRNGSIGLMDEKVMTWRIMREDGDKDAEMAEERELIALYSGSDSSGAADPMAVGFDGHTVHVEDMVEAIRDNRDPIISGRDARHAVEICVAIQESAATGKEITLESAR